MSSAKLAALVCKHMRAVFRAHRRALKNNVEYCARTRLIFRLMRMGVMVKAPQRMMMRCNMSMVLSEIQHP